MLWHLLVILVLLVLSAFFAVSETALFSLTPGRREELRNSRPKAARRIDALLSDTGRLLGTLLLGNLVVNTAASSIFTLMLLGLSRRHGMNEALLLGVGGIVLTLVLLMFCEVTPKVVTSRSPERFAPLVTGPIEVARLLLWPFTALLMMVSRRLTPRRREPETLTDDELHTMIDIGRQRGVLLGSEEDILANLVGLERRTVSEVMTPRIDIVAIPEGMTIREAIVVCRNAGFSRVPVYSDTIDHISGTAYAKDLLSAADPGAPVCSRCRPAYFVPEVKRLPSLLDELRRRGSHIAVVVDEFGQTSGLVTLEDLLEAVFGEIVDEHDVAEELPYSKLDEHSYLVDGEIDLATLNRLFRRAFTGLGHERLSGFIQDRLGRLPREGDVIAHRSLEIIVKETDGPKLEKVLIKRK
ncbi:MAG TPA: hemolysin family protein [bacterium]|nr:hemolysin family protein [bacterium]